MERLETWAESHKQRHESTYMSNTGHVPTPTDNLLYDLARAIILEQETGASGQEDGND